MTLFYSKTSLFNILAIVILMAGAGYFYAANLHNNQSGAVELTDLSDADIDLIVEVKTAMYAASIESY